MTWVHEKARKIVFPTATFRKCVNTGKGILGAEYKKVTNAVMINQNHSWINKMEKIAEPMRPIKNKIRCNCLFFIFHMTFSVGPPTFGGVRYQWKL